MRYIELLPNPNGEQDKSGENRSKCSAVGLMFPHPDYILFVMILYHDFSIHLLATHVYDTIPDLPVKPTVTQQQQIQQQQTSGSSGATAQVCHIII